MVGDDTNPLIGKLPCQIYKLYLRPESKQGENHPPKCWSIALLRITVGPEVYRNVSFMHHIVRWYTTSGVGIGKTTVLTLVQYFGNSELVFNDLNSSKADMISIGEDALVALYKDKPGETLGHLRLQKFYHKVIVKS